jgi:hypothetical protein
MDLPILVAHWEFDCCGPTLSPGDRWSVAVFTSAAGAEPAADREPGFVPERAGTVELVGDVAHVGLHSTGVIDVGELRVHANDLQHTGRIAWKDRIRGRWHGDWDYGDMGLREEEISVSGVVQRVWRMPIVWGPVTDHRGEVLPGVVGHRDPIETSSTEARRAGEDLLIELELAPAR